jgi:GTPase
MMEKLNEEEVLILQNQCVPMVVRSEEDVVVFSKQILCKLVVPVFVLSNLCVGTLDHFIRFLNLLPSNNELTNNADMPPEFVISTTYELAGTTVLGGTVLKGVIKDK